MAITFNSKQKIALFVALFIIVADQLLKFWTRVNLADGSVVEVASWFKLCYVQNPGAAFGMTFGPKIFLTIFRIFAVGCLFFCSCRIAKRTDFSLAFVVAFVMIAAGATGNIIDCVFYAKVFDGGDWLVGKVVDMLYFPLFRFSLPDWIPLLGGQSYLFFSPVFNLADAAITCGPFYMMFFRFKELTKFTDLCSEKISLFFSMSSKYRDDDDNCKDDDIEITKNNENVEK